MAFHRAMDWHEGEVRIHELTHKLRDDNPTSPFLTPRAAAYVQRYTVMALGTVDDQNQIWCTVWGTGEPPLAQQVAPSILGIKSVVDGSFDPVVETLYGSKKDGEIVKPAHGQTGRMVSGLSIELEERGRVKLFGNMVAGALSTRDTDPEETEPTEKTGQAADAQLVLKIEQSIGNCPKYLNKKHITSVTPQPVLLSDSLHLSDAAIELVHNADLLFVASAHEHEDMDANHRGGPQGFIRVHNDMADSGSVIVWPEYSGNNLYQTLGNLMTTPRAGLCIPDFNTGDVLYMTGTTEVLVGSAASSVIAKSNLAVKFTVTAARHVKEGLPFRGTNIDDAAEGRSPYNPRVRFLTSERSDDLTNDSSEPSVTAKLIAKTPITPTIIRYRFSLSDPSVHGPWKPGQYVALDFSHDLKMGYSHMRDDDPTSLNDDYIRTFTVSSIPNVLGVHGEEFEMTVRKVGSVTGFLSHQRISGMGLEVGVRGFGGEFVFDFEGAKGKIGFIAAGIGITPLLGQMGMPELQPDSIKSNVQVLWSVGIRDVNLAYTMLEDFPQLRNITTIFLTGDESALKLPEMKREREASLKLQRSGANVQMRRLAAKDLQEADKKVSQWYLCTAPAMRKQVQEWLPGKSITFENFDY